MALTPNLNHGFFLPVIDFHSQASSRKGNTAIAFQTEYERKLEDLRQFVEREEAGECSIPSLIMADAVQRLGFGNHCDKEIGVILNKYYLKARDSIHQCNSLRDVSLMFRLLRHQGYDVPSDAFNNFKDKDGWFRGELRQDIRGLMELYDAAQLSFEGETVLDEAEEFSSQVLHEYCLSDHGEHPHSNDIRIRLRHPYHKSITQLTQRDILLKDHTSGTKCRWKNLLRALVEMDFHMQQTLFQDEVFQVSKWWKGLGLAKELKLARNQPLKWHTWSMTMLIGDMRLSEERVLVTKSIAFIYLIDDIFDLYGTPHDLALFTQAIKRWEPAATDMLPDYMKMCYKALLDTTNDIAHVIWKKHHHNPTNYLKQTWASLCDAFLVEAKWFNSNSLPGAQEYLENGKVSSGVHVVLVLVYFLLGLSPGTHGNQIPLNGNTSTLISCVATILRLWDDLGSAKDEHQDGKDGSYIACYLKDNPHLSLEHARKHVAKMIANEWKRLNRESFSWYNMSSTRLSFQEASLNLARMVPQMYSYGVRERLPVLEEHV